MADSIWNAKYLVLGRQGENKAREISVDISSWQERYPGATIKLYIQRPGEVVPYVAENTEISGTKLIWKPSSVDTAKSGWGMAELRAVKDDIIEKSDFIKTNVAPSLTGEIVGNPPSAVQTWIDKLETAVDSVNGKLDAPEEAGTTGQVLTLGENGESTWATVHSGEGGSTVEVQAELSPSASTTKVARITVDGTPTDIYAPNTSGVESDIAGISSALTTMGQRLTTIDGILPNTVKKSDYATANAAGIVKVGEGLSIDNVTGVLSASGSNVQVTPTLQSGTKVATITVNGTPNDILAPTQPSLENYVQKTDYASSSDAGVVKVSSQYGVEFISSGNKTLKLTHPNDSEIKAGVISAKAITPDVQHKAVFYGLAKAAGDATQAASDNEVGTYTEDAKEAIRDMLGVGSGGGSDVSVVQIQNDGTKIAEIDVDGVTTELYAPSDTGDTVTVTPIQQAGTKIATIAVNSTSADIYAPAAPDISGKADKTGTVLNTTLSRGRKANTTSGTGSIAFGSNPEASGSYSVAFGSDTKASGQASFAGGYLSEASGLYAQAYGTHAVASGAHAHAEGIETVANHKLQHVFGIHNVGDPSSTEATAYGTYIEIVGNGTGPSDKSNARALDWNGNEYLKGDLYINANASSGSGTPVGQAISGKADKVSGATNGNFASLDGNGNLVDSGHKHGDYLTSHQDISGKADKVANATNGHFAALDSNGNLTDSGHQHSDYLTQHQDISGKLDAPSTAGTSGQVLKLDSNLNTTWATVGDGVTVSGTTATVTDLNGFDPLPSGGTAGDVLEMGTNGPEWSSDVTDLKSAIETKSETKSTTEAGVDLDLADENGNVILELKNGHIRTKYFDSSQSANATGIVARNKDTLDGIYAACRWHQPNSTDKQFCMLMGTDFHGDSTRLASMVEFLNAVDAFDAGICLGDIAANTWQDDATYYTTAISNAEKPFLTVIGNHDAGSGVAMSTGYTNIADLVDKFITPNIQYADLANGEYPSGKSYYFKDFAAYGIRLVVLNNYEYPTDNDGTDFLYRRGYNCWSQDQVDWFVSTLNATPSGYGVIVAAHFVPTTMAFDKTSLWTSSTMQYASWTPDSILESSDKNMMADIVNAWVNGTTLNDTYSYNVSGGSWAGITVSADFTARGTGEFITWIGGHLHMSLLGNIYSYSDQPVYLANWSATGASAGDTPRKIGTKSEDALCVLAVDRTLKTVKLFRVGAHFTMDGLDRLYGKYSYGASE